MGNHGTITPASPRTAGTPRRRWGDMQDALGVAVASVFATLRRDKHASRSLIRKIAQPTTYYPPPTRLAPSKNQFKWFGHLVGPIMGCYALIEGDFFYFIYVYFPGVCQQNKGSHNIGGVLPTSEWVINAKQANLREIKPLFCTYQHVANTKIAPKCTFCPKNDLFSLFRLICPQRGVLGASGLWTFGPKSSVDGHLFAYRQLARAKT